MTTQPFPRRTTNGFAAGLLLGLVVAVGCNEASNQQSGETVSSELPTVSEDSAQPSADDAVLQTRGATMGTYYNVTLFDPPADLPEDWEVELDITLRRINDEMSTYLETSEISKFNASTSTEWMEVSPGFAFVVAKALDICEVSGGAFDITVAPLVDAWSFGPEQRRKEPPSEEEIASLRKLVGFQNVEVRMDPPALRKTNAQLRIDLSAIAKGYGVDQLVEQLAGWGCKHAFVDIGGENRAIGRRGDRDWRVAIEDPIEGRREYHLVFNLQDRAIATSGDYRNYFEYDGKRYSHTIDPRTGRPIEHGLATVSVFADDCMTADAWATAINVLGSTEGLSIAQEQGLSVRMLERNADGTFKTLRSDSFPEPLNLD